jgi:hypothetical protein
MSRAKPPVACEACAGYPYGTGRVHCNGCAESASLRQRLATAEADRDLAGGVATAALADAAALRERVTRAEALLREMVDGTGTAEACGCVFCRAGAFLADRTEPDGASGTKGKP